jgi:hypothetical protein
MKRTLDQYLQHTTPDNVLASVFEEIPSELRNEIRHMFDGHFKSVIYRARLQRVCKLFYNEDPGLIYPHQLKPYIEDLPTGHPSFQGFLHEIVYANLLGGIPFNNIVNLTTTERNYSRHMALPREISFKIGMEFREPGELRHGHCIVITNSETGLRDHVSAVVFNSSGLARRSHRNTITLRHKPYPWSLLWNLLDVDETENGEIFGMRTSHRWSLTELLALIRRPSAYAANESEFEQAMQLPQKRRNGF